MTCKIIKKITTLLIIFYILISLIYNVKALTLQEMQNQVNGWKNAGSTGSSKVDWGNTVKDFADLGSILTTIGAGVMVIITTYMGIKYLTSGPDAQAKLKTQLIGVVVSGVVIFGAYNIWKLVIDIAGKF